jgi:hypothetical protein
MYRLIDRIKLLFLAIFAAVTAAMLIYHFGWVRPAQKCEVEQHKWWDPAGRVCATPVLISDITGRTIEDKAAEAEALKAIGRPVPKAAVPHAAPKP